MSVLTYNTLALDWQPAEQRNRRFNALTAGVLIVVLALAFVLEVIPVPETERRQRAAVPPRVARFISEKPKPVEPIEQPKPKPLPPPKAEPTPTVKRERPEVQEQQPLTEAQKTAREKAQNSGLLALHNELSDLMDTSKVSNMVRGELNTDAAAGELAAGHDLAAVTEGAATGGGGVDSGRYGSKVGATQLSAREVAQVRSGLFDGTAAEGETADDTSDRAGKGNGRSREDVTMVFDRNKGTLYSLYARERRRSPGLQGKIIFKITIAPSGDVTHVEIVSSELNNPSLEAGIMGRIKLFKFEAQEVDELTVTYPIEFLPS